MAVALIFPILLVAVITGYSCEPTNGYNNNNVNGATHFGDLLKPPPPPLLPVVPVPFHGGIKLGGGNSISQRQNFDSGYHYQPPSSQSQPALPISTINDFKFPAPFYKQYNFNFVPPPQPFTTTPSPSVFQKVSNWLFPSQEITYDTQSEIISNYNAATFKKDCNPCNLVPWIPVIRYDLAAKNLRQNINPTYGPPSPTASANVFNSVQNVPQPFSNQNYEPNKNHISNNNQHSSYGAPNLAPVASTYGPPSPTHIVDVSQPRPLSSPFSSNSFTSLPYNIQTTTIKPVTFNQPVSLSYGLPSSNYGFPHSTTATPFPPYDNNFLTTTSSPFLTNQRPELFNQQFPQQNDVEIFTQSIPSQELQLPKVTRPTGFRNSYGEPIENSYALNVPYSATATGAESSKVKTEVLPDNSITSHVENMTLALANPAPFTLNRGRNIHTLQPVALPNLSISPLPPIFNARPFRPVPQKYFGNILYGSNKKQSDSKNLNIAQSVPLAEYTHSVEYPTTFIQSPVIDIDDYKNFENQTKGYRNIQNSFVIDEIRDISPQASDHHISAAKTNPDSSFESTGPDIGNELFEGSIQSELSSNNYTPPNHKPAFADLRNVKDELVDKYRTESNLQHIDSPLLYLKPSAPHKNYENFFSSASTPEKDGEYEIYDDTPTTPIPVQSTPTIWDSSRTYYMEESSAPIAQQSTNQAKIVQIIVPYTINHKEFIDDNNFDIQQESQGRKVHTENNNNFVTIPTESYSSIGTTTDGPISTITEQYNSELFNTPAILNDLYDVKEPPFDIIKLQHTIDDWTEQEYSNQYNEPQRVRSNEKYAKQIPDNFFTTSAPITNYATEINNYNYDTYDHEFSSSNQHVVTDNKTSIFSKASKGYNNIERTKANFISGKNEEEDERLHIYTAASTFRTTTTTTTTTTSAPWGSIQTSISPLTNEKVYVVTSKPWREKQSNVLNKTYEFDKFEPKKTSAHSYVSTSDEVIIKPPKSFHRPSSGSFHRTSNGFRIGNGRLNSTKFDSSYTYSNGWHRRINNLDEEIQNEYYEDLEDMSLSQEKLTNKTNASISESENAK